MRVLGIDPGSSTTGYGVIDTDGRKHSLAEYGTIKPRAGMSFAEKLLYIEEQLQAIIERLKPDALAIEEAFYAVNVKSALMLGQVRGVALLVAARAGLPIYEYSALEVKSATTGYGRAEKHQVQQMVKILLGLPEVPQPHDAADALAVAICHIHHWC